VGESREEGTLFYLSTGASTVQALSKVAICADICMPAISRTLGQRGLAMQCGAVMVPLPVQ